MKEPRALEARPRERIYYVVCRGEVLAKYFERDRAKTFIRAFNRLQRGKMFADIVRIDLVAARTAAKE